MAQSSKAVAGFNDMGLAAIPAEGTTLMALNIKTAKYSDLLINVAMQCNLTTRTKGKTNTDSTGIVADTATATAGLGVKVTVDGATVVIPNNTVTFCKRSQTLTVELGQALAECTLSADTDADGLNLYGPNCKLDDQSVELILDTLDTHSFNFTALDLEPGWHTVTIEGFVTDDGETGDASANAVIGVASATVEEVRFVKGLDVDLSD
jgi:hypothetical protein